ncbi:unnamed protein product, partial [Amoebophrya sp. A25]
VFALAEDKKTFDIEHEVQKNAHKFGFDQKNVGESAQNSESLGHRFQPRHRSGNFVHAADASGFGHRIESSVGTAISSNVASNSGWFSLSQMAQKVGASVDCLKIFFGPVLLSWTDKYHDRENVGVNIICDEPILDGGKWSQALFYEEADQQDAEELDRQVLESVSHVGDESYVQGRSQAGSSGMTSSGDPASEVYDPNASSTMGKRPAPSIILRRAPGQLTDFPAVQNSHPSILPRTAQA